MRGKPLKFGSQRILRQSVVRGEKCLAVLDTGEFFSHHPNSHFNYPPKHCKEKAFDLVCFQQASVSLCLVLTLPPIPTRLMNFSPLLSLFNLCLQVVHQALLHLGNQRITGTAWVPRNGGTQERSIFVGIHGGAPPRSPSPHWNSESCGQQSRWRAKASEWRNMEMLFCSGRFFLCLNFSDFWSDPGCLRNYSVLIFARHMKSNCGT